MDRLRWPVAIATLAGLAVAVWTIGAVGLARLADVAATLGLGGFALICLASLLLFTLLGGAWLAALPGGRLDQLGAFAGARIVREAANDLLPFSQLGALVLAMRALAGIGVPTPRIGAALIVDLTTELATQAAVTVFALWLLGTLAAGVAADWVWTGALLAIALMIAFILANRRLVRLGRGIAVRLLPGTEAGMDSLAAELDRAYASRRRVALSLVLNLAGWIASGLLAWAILRLIGSDASLGHALALEWLIAALRSVAFLVPGAIGVQEAGYALLAPLLLIDPASAVALSLVKRARDLAVGAPTLLIWQAAALRTKRARQPTG